MAKTGDSIANARTLHLIDLENLLGDQRKDPSVAAVGLNRYLELAVWRPGDHVLVAAHHEIIKSFAFDPPVACNAHAVCGPDAADEVLLENAPAEFVARRYGRLVIGSGDHKFVRRARELRDRRVGVLVVAPAGGCASGFRRHGFPVLDFDLDPIHPDGPLDLAA
jgi:hypothetical protein